MSDPSEFLATAPPPVDNPDLRRRLLARTLTVLRRRRWLRRARLAAVLAGCFAAGVWTMSWLRPTPGPVPNRGDAADRNRPVPAERDDDHSTPKAPAVVELVKAADHILIAEGDPLTALHGYSKALDEGGDDALRISTDDSFLMIALKDARKREKDHAKKLD
jgi:hypothetical protein